MSWRADGGGGATALDRARETYPVSGTLKHAGLSGFQLDAGASGLTISEVEGPDNAADFAGVSLTAGQELIFAQPITLLQLSAGSGVVYNSTERSAEWFVSSHSGSDGNSGLAPTSQLRTIAGLTEVYFVASGDTITLDDDSFWREEIQIQSLANNTIRRSGTGSERPILDASDVTTGWGLSSGQSNTYELAWTPESGNGVTDARITAYEDGDLLIYRDTIAEVESNPGSYTVDGFADTAGNIVYIHPSDSGDPNNNGSTYEVTKRRNCIWCGPGTTVDGVHLRRNINNNG
ncbi:MAG: hypothetical protein AAF808_23955, partial [Cyanobacteria bacterium P01_D01_bin.2]